MIHNTLPILRKNFTAKYFAMSVLKNFTASHKKFSFSETKRKLFPLRLISPAYKVFTLNFLRLFSLKVI